MGGGRLLKFRLSVISLVVIATGVGGVAASPGQSDEARSRQVRPEETALVQSRLSAVKVPDPRALAEALGVRVVSEDSPSDVTQNFLQVLGDLDSDGISEFVLEWTGDRAAGGQGDSSRETVPAWSLFMMAWDGSGWRGSPLMSGFEPFAVRVLPATSSGERAIAVTVYAGLTEVPYPAIFRFEAHRASLAWDGRSDETLYQGYDNGVVEFASAEDALQMIATGRANPGFLIFPKNSRRGFDARTIYRWDGKAFRPVKTEYSTNADFTLYRFISALHRRDFRAAYTLIAPAKFLKTAKPGPEVFRKTIEDAWPEFLDDQIFRARDSGPEDSAFTLKAQEKLYVYTPTFSDGAPPLLAGLEREEREPESE